MGRPAETHRLRLTHPLSVSVAWRTGVAADLPDMTGVFPQSLARHGFRYTLLEPIHPDRARFLFTGPFQGRDIQWDTTLSRLTGTDTLPFIDVGSEGQHGRILNVALAIPAVDEPALLRVIIMIRQYKRLQPGRHVFGRPAID